MKVAIAAAVVGMLALLPITAQAGTDCKLTRSDFSAISIGTSYHDVVVRVGCEGEELAADASGTCFSWDGVKPYMYGMLCFSKPMMLLRSKVNFGLLDYE